MYHASANYQTDDKPRHRGTVKFFSDKGYGFIIADEPAVNNGSDIFVHVTACGGANVEKGAHVSFEVALDKKSGKIAAHNVRIER